MNSPMPKFFVWRGNYRAEFVTLLDAMAWCSKHGGVVTESPTKPVPGARMPTAGQIAMAESCGSSSGEE